MSLYKPDSPCGTCRLGSCKTGFVPADGDGSNGVLIVLEAAGEHEAKEGKPVVGKAGYYLFQNLARIGIRREGFRIHNVLSCRPPNNKLAGMSWEKEVIDHCAPLLDATIATHVRESKARGLTPTILTLGRIAFKRIMRLGDKDPLMREDYLCYPHWSEEYGCFVVAADHPSYLMRGNNHLLPVLQFAAQRALEIASHGLRLEEPQYLLDPAPGTFQQWADDYVKAIASGAKVYLSYDIETPMKQGRNEEKVAKEDDDDYTILRISFAYRPGEAISVPWRAEYLPGIATLFSIPSPKVGWNNSGYDSPRIKAQMHMAGDEIDAMLAWHVLNSALPKGLGFVTPFYVKNTSPWKHLSNSSPAFYNAKDADMALRNWLGIAKDLKSTDLGKVFDRHVVELNRVLTYMSEQGVQRDETLRKSSEVKIAAMLDAVEASMVDAVPQEVRKFQVYKKVPKVTKGLVMVDGTMPVAVCPACTQHYVKADHFKSIGKRRLKAGQPENPCLKRKAVKVITPTKLWAKPLDFKVSVKSLSSYQKSLRHQAIVNRRENRVTFDEDAIKQLVKVYPNDRLYPAILKHREYQKLLSNYIGVTNKETGLIRGGMQIGRDGRIHAQFTHNPSTLRMACQNPNMQNLPRAKGKDDLQTIVRDLIVASDGNILLELDFSAIEAVLVGYFAGLPDYIRLAKLGIHSYLASHVLGRPADLKWSTSDLRKYFAEIKGSEDQAVKDIYNGSKRAIHLSGYGGTPRKMHTAEPETFKTVKDAERLQGIYFDLFPAVKKWQFSCQMQADKDGFLRNPFGYVHRFYRVFSYAKECGKWVRKQGDDANKVLAFLPQSTAAGIIKEAMLRLYFERFEEAGVYMRLQVHDSLVSDVPRDRVNGVKAIFEEEMTRPVPELRLPPMYGMGDALSIDVEAKVGERWGSMK